MNKRFLSIIALILVMCFVLVSCGDTVTTDTAAEAHEHIYDKSEWVTDETMHWHAATCDSEDSCADARTDIQGHTDKNNDGICDVCEYVYDADHEHSFVDFWSYDANNHWHISDCYHAVRSEVSKHTPDEFGTCTVCGYQVSEPDFSSVDSAVKVGIAQKDLVIAGVLYTASGLTLDSVSPDREIVYEFRADHFYTSEYVSGAKVETFYSQTAGGAIFAVTVNEYGDEELLYNANEYNLLGVEIPTSFVGNADAFASYGAEDLLATVYEIAKENANLDYTEKYDDKEGIYSFSFGYYTQEYGLFVIEVAFTLNENNYSIENLGISSKNYSSNKLVEVPGVDGAPSTWAIATEGEGADAVEVAPTQVYLLVMEQVCDITVENPYNPDNLVISDYDLKYENGDLVENNTINILSGSKTTIHFDNISPEGADFKFATIEFAGPNVNSDDFMHSLSVMNNSGHGDISSFWLRSWEAAGTTYVLDIIVNGNVETYTVNVIAPPAAPVAEMHIGSIVDNSGNYQFTDIANGDTIFITEGDSYILGAFLDNNSGTFSFTITPSVGYNLPTDRYGLWDDATESYITAYTIDLADLPAGDFAITITSSADSSFTKTVNVSVAENPNAGGDVEASLLALGDTDISPETVAYTYTASAAGTLNLSLGIAIMGAVDVTYSVNGGTPTTLAVQSSASVALNVGDVVRIDIISAGYVTLTASYDVGGSSEAPIVGNGSETEPFIVSGVGSVVISANHNNPIYVQVEAGYTVTLGFEGHFSSNKDNSDNLGTAVYAETTTTYCVFADSLAGATGTMTSSAGNNAGGGEGGDDDNDSFDLIIGYNSIDATNVTLIYTATEDGTIVLDLGTAIMGGVEIEVLLNGFYYTDIYTETAESIDLVAGDVLTLYVKADGYATLYTEWSAGTSGGITADLEIGHTPVNAENGTYTYVAGEDGILTIVTEAAIMGPVDFYYSINGGAEMPFFVDSTTDIALHAGDVLVVTVVAEGYSAFNTSFEAGAIEDGPAGATDINECDGNGSKADPYQITEEGVYFMSQVNDYPGQFITFNAVEDMTITIMADVAEIYSPSFSTKYANPGEAYTFELAAGESISFTVCMFSGTSDVYLTVTYGGNAGGGEGGENPPAGADLYLGLNAINATTSVLNYTADANGELFLGLEGIRMGEVMVDVFVNGSYVTTLDASNLETTLYLFAGDVVTLYASAEEYAQASLFADWVADGPVGPTISNLQLGITSIDAVSATYIFTANANGELFLALEGIIMGEVTVDIFVNGSYAFSLGAYENQTLDLFEGDEVTIYIYAEGYSQLYSEWNETGSTEPTPVDLPMGNTQINAENAIYVFNAAEDGILTITMGAAIMGPVDVTYSINGGAASTINVSTTANISVKAGDVVTITVEASGYSSLTASFEAGAIEDGPAGATDITECEGDGSKADPYQITEAGVYFLAQVNSYPGKYVVFTATADMTITLTTDVSEIYTSSFSTCLATTGGTYTFDLAAGESKTLAICMYSGTSDVYLTVSFEGNEGGDEGGDEPIVTPEYDLFVGGINAINFESANYNFTAAENGELFLALGEAMMGDVQANIYINGELFDILTPYGMFTLTLEAGDVIKLEVIAEGSSELYAEWTAVGGVTYADLVLGNNNIEAENIIFTYYATANGKLILDLGTAIMGDVVAEVYVNGSFAYTLNVNSAIELELFEGDEVTVEFEATGYASMYAEFTEDAPAAVTEAPLNMGTTQINAENMILTYTAAEAGVLTLTMGAAIMGPVDVTYSVNGGNAYTINLQTSVDVTVAAGDVVVIYVEAEGYSSITASFVAGEPVAPSEGTDITECTGSGTLADPYQITEAGTYLLNEVNAYPGQYIIFTAAEDMSITLVADVAQIYTSAWMLVADAYAPYTFNLVAGESMCFTVCMESGSADVELEVAFGEYTAPAAPEVPTDPLNMGNSQINAANVNYGFTAPADGELYLSMGAAIMGPVEVNVSVNGEFVSGIEINGNLTLPLAAGDRVVIEIIATGYSSIYAEWKAATGSEEVALEIGNNNIEQADVNYVYTAETEGKLILELGNAIMGGVEINVYINGESYDVMYTSTTLVLSLDEGDEVICEVLAEGYATLIATWEPVASGDVSSGVLVMGNNNINAENAQLTYTATANGTITLTLSGAIMGPVDVTYSVNGNGMSALYVSSSANVIVREGDVVTIIINAEGYATLSASFEEGEVVDNNDATDITEFAGSGTLADPYQITEEGVFFLAQVNAYPGKYISFTAESEMTITIKADVSEIYTSSWTRVAAENQAYTFTLAAGETRAFTVCMYSGTSDVYLEVDFEGGAIGGGDIGGGEATPEYDLVAGLNTINAENCNLNFVADAEGELFLSLDTAMMGDVKIEIYVNGSLVDFILPGDIYTLTLYAGDEVTLEVTAEGYASLYVEWNVAGSNGGVLNLGSTNIEAADVTYTFTADSNGDLFLDLGVAIMGEVTIEVYVNGSYAEYLAPYNSVTISLFEGDEVVINVYAEGYATLYAEWLGAGNVGGGDVNYETEIAVGNNTLYFSAEEIAADAASREAYIDVEGNYSFNSGTLFVSSVVDAFGNTISKNEDYTITLTPGYYTINFSMLSMFGVEADVAQELIVEASESEGGEEGDGEESLESMFAGFYTVDGYSVYIYNDNGVYIFNAYLFDADVNIDNYYTFVAYDNYDGSYAIYLEYYQHEAETGYDELELLDKSFTATYNGESWVITRDRAYGELESMLVGTYTFDEFEVEIYEEDSIYVFNVYSFDFSIDNYYGMVAVEQADGSVYIYIYYSENTNETGYDEFGLENEIFVATQDGNGNWSLEILVVDIPEYELGLGYTNSINAEDMVLTFTAQEDGELFLSLEAIIMGPVDIAVYKNGEILGYLYQYDQVTIDLVAGDEIEIVITAEGYSAIYADWTSSAPAAAAALAMGNTSIEASDATYVYTANDSCTLTLSLGATIMGDVVIEVYVNDSFAYSFTTNEFVEVSLFAGDNVTVVVSAAGYGTLNAEISFKNAVTFPL